MLKNIRLLVAISFGLFGWLSYTSHTLVCIQNDTQTTQQRVKCEYHYDYKALDNYHCYIRFGTLGSDIKLVDERDPRAKLGINALPAAGYYQFDPMPEYKKMYLLFLNPGTKPGQVDVQTLHASSRSVDQIATALQTQPQIYKDPTPADLDDIANVYLSVPLAGCMMQ